jgi:hypothetical protein
VWEPRNSGVSRQLWTGNRVGGECLAQVMAADLDPEAGHGELPGVKRSGILTR